MLISETLLYSVTFFAVNKSCYFCYILVFFWIEKYTLKYTDAYILYVYWSLPKLNSALYQSVVIITLLNILWLTLR